MEILKLQNISMSDFVNNTSQGTISTPEDMLSLVTTMRVRAVYSGPATPTACGTYAGEVEDYTLIIKCLDGDNDEVCNASDVCEGVSDTPLVLTESPTINETSSAVTTISSIVIVNSDRNITYKAGTSISLKAGFEAKSGAVFHAMIEDCTNTPLTITEAEINQPTIPTVKVAKIISTTPTLAIFPNPFTNATTIDYALPKDSPLQIKVMDLTGKIISVLLDNPMQLAGNYQLIWEAPTNFSGMLFLSFQTNEQVMVKELVVVNR